MDLPSIQQLRNFIIYGKYGNFTTAANAANITQSAFSAQMKKLEDLVGVRLIERSKSLDAGWQDVLHENSPHFR